MIPVSSETISSIPGRSISFGWFLTNNHVRIPITTVIPVRMKYVSANPRFWMSMTIGVAAAIPPTLPTRRRIPLIEANSFFLNQTANTFMIGI